MKRYAQLKNIETGRIMHGTIQGNWFVSITMLPYRLDQIPDGYRFVDMSTRTPPSTKDIVTSTSSIVAYTRADGANVVSYPDGTFLYELLPGDDNPSRINLFSIIEHIKLMFSCRTNPSGG